MNEEADIRSAIDAQEGRGRNSRTAPRAEIPGTVLRPASDKRGRGRREAAKVGVVGLKVRLARKPICHNGICSVAMANEPDAGEWICADCVKHRAWLSRETAKSIEGAQSRLGAEMITIGTPQERRELNNRDYELPDGARIEVVNPAYPPRLYLSRLY